MPRLSASKRALAVGAEVNEYAWTSISAFAFFIFSIIAAVNPPF
jgi:hypothetical protein